MKHYYLGIDASKGYADFILLDKNKRYAEDAFQLDDTFLGHRSLMQFLATKLTENCKIIAGIESTGGYENNWFNAVLKSKTNFNIEITRLNPLGVHYYSKSKLTRVTNDSISAQMIAEYLISHEKELSFEADMFKSERRLSNFIQNLVKQKTQLLNQLESMLYIAHPGLLKYCSNGVNRWVLLLLKAYPTAKKLAHAKERSLSKIPFISQDRAKNLIEEAKKSISSDKDSLTEIHIKSPAEHILSLENTIKEHSKLLNIGKLKDDIELLTSLRGIGDVSVRSKPDS